MRNVTAEQALIARLRSGDQTAVGDLATEYGSRIFQLAFRYMKNREDAEEVVQDVLLKVFHKIDAFRGDAALSSWIYRITFNTAMSRLRTGRVARQASLDEPYAVSPEDARPALHEAVDWTAMADERMLRIQMRERLEQAVRELPDIYRAPVVLRDLQGLSTEEASSRLKLKDQTLKSRLHRGRLILRQRLADFAGGLTLWQPPAGSPA